MRENPFDGIPLDGYAAEPENAGGTPGGGGGGGVNQYGRPKDLEGLIIAPAVCVQNSDGSVTRAYPWPMWPPNEIDPEKYFYYMRSDFSETQYHLRQVVPYQQVDGSYVLDNYGRDLTAVVWPASQGRLGEGTIGKHDLNVLCFEHAIQIIPTISIEIQ